jgi:hypothetical protein
VIDRFKINRKEADVFLPVQKIGVEFHGLIWHSTKFSKSPTDDFKKHRLFQENGIRLIHIYQDEWEFRNDQVKRLLLAAIGKSTDGRVFARNLVVTTINEDVAAGFYDKNHIQGRIGNPCISYGLLDNSELVAAMSFSRITSMRGTSKTDGEFELRRYATSKNVIGGASKLLSYFVKETGNVTKIVSYSENRLFSGGLYEKIGFSKDFVSKPSYWYVHPSRKVRFPKAAFKRSALSKMKDFVFDPSKSERENCENNGYFQLYDCGKTRWVLNLVD